MTIQYDTVAKCCKWASKKQPSSLIVRTQFLGLCAHTPYFKPTGGKMAGSSSEHSENYIYIVIWYIAPNHKGCFSCMLYSSHVYSRRYISTDINHSQKMMKNGKFKAAMVSHTPWVDHPAISIACRCRRRILQRWRCICRARAGFGAGAQFQGLRFLRRTWIPWIPPKMWIWWTWWTWGFLWCVEDGFFLPCLTLVYFMSL